MHITGMTVNGGPPFNGKVEFVFEQRVNVLVGANSTGKTSIIKMLGHPPNDHPDSDSWETDRGQFWLEVSEDWPEIFDASWAFPDWRAAPFIYVGAVRKGVMFAQSKSGSPSLGTGEMSLDDIFQHCHEADLFDANLMDSALSLVMQEAAERGGSVGGLSVLSRVAGWGDLSLAEFHLQTAVEQSYRCAQAICKDMVTGDSAGNIVIPSRRAGIYENPPVIRPAASIETRFDGQVAVDHLSSGIQSSLLWIRFLALRMVHHYQFELGWHEKPAILLIDEIENHLHPTWQRRVIPALLEHFPGLQIFATTHSPFVVAGLRAGQVHMLKRGADGVVTASTNEQDIIGWTTDEILRTFMGVDEPTDQLTINRRERLLELRRKDSLSDEETAEMEDLRRQVNEDFLSSSTPLEAQRERYGDMMLEFLRSRQSELSQDGN